VDENTVINWLLEGDAAVRWQVHRDLLSSSEEKVREERKRIENSGWGLKILSFQGRNDIWDGLGKIGWRSAMYNLQLLRRLGLLPGIPRINTACQIMLDKGLHSDGGIQYEDTKSEMCQTAMSMAIFAYFQIQDERLEQIISYIISNQLDDGGWNCRHPRVKTNHSSFNTTFHVLEALQQIKQNLPEYFSSYDISGKLSEGIEFLLQHRLYKSHTTGEIADSQFTNISFPPRHKYDIMSGLDFLQSINHPTDERCSDAVNLIKRRQKQGKWPMGIYHQGLSFFKIEDGRQPSRMNTLRGLRIVKWWHQ